MESIPRMKVLMILDQEFPPDIRVENEIESLTGAGIEVHLSCYTRKQKPSYEKKGLLTIHRFPINEFTYKSSVAVLSFPHYFNFWRRNIEKLTGQIVFDAVHIHDLPLVQVGLELGDHLRIPVIADLHENWPAFLQVSSHTRTLAGRLLSSARQWRDYELKVLNRANRIIVVVDEARQRIINLGIDADKIHVVSNCLNIDHFVYKEDTGRREELQLVYAGGLTFHRGLQTVIQALAHLNADDPKFIFHIAGDGRYRKSLESLSKDLGIENKVLFHGYVPYKEVVQAIAMADYPIIPHLRSAHTDSTIPHKLFQYMYAAKPVISSDCAPLSRIIHEVHCGYIYESGNSESLAGVFKKLDRKNDATMGVRGRDAVKHKYNWEREGRNLLALYSKLTTQDL